MMTPRPMGPAVGDRPPVTRTAAPSHPAGGCERVQPLAGPRPLRLLAWETTTACTLACSHCRARAVTERGRGELTTAEGRDLLEQVARLRRAQGGGPVIVILSGGEPLVRDDLEELAAHASSLGLRPVVATNDGDLLTAERIERLRTAGVVRVSFSIHDDRPEAHDAFVGRPGAQAAALAAVGRLRAAGVEVQINTSITRDNHRRLSDLHRAVVATWLPAAWHLFFLVPTGRALGHGRELFLDALEVEQALQTTADLLETTPVPIQVTCAPMFQRVLIARGRKPTGSGSACLAADGFLFVGAEGDVKPCGYFDRGLGNIRRTPIDELVLTSPDIRDVRRPPDDRGRCLACQYRTWCGGCRARALARHGTALADDPLCTHTPPTTAAADGAGSQDPPMEADHG